MNHVFAIQKQYVLRLLSIVLLVSHSDNDSRHTFNTFNSVNAQHCVDNNYELPVF